MSDFSETTRIKVEDTLKYLFTCLVENRASSVEGLAGVLRVGRNEASRLLDLLQHKELVRFREQSHELTDSGRSYAAHIVRAHRLYETFLARETGTSEVDWHREADREEHSLTPSAANNIAARLGYPRFDPHGDPIPLADGTIPEKDWASLRECLPPWSGVITHIEDEPEELYAEIVAHHLAPGSFVELAAQTGTTTEISVEGVTVKISSAAAKSIFVAEANPEDSVLSGTVRLSVLNPGDIGTVVALSPSCRGPERSRLLDLGVVPGTEVVVGSPSMFGSPRMYQLRGTTVALRTSQADRILVEQVRE